MLFSLNISLPANEILILHKCSINKNLIWSELRFIVNTACLKKIQQNHCIFNLLSKYFNDPLKAVTCFVAEWISGFSFLLNCIIYLFTYFFIFYLNRSHCMQSSCKCIILTCFFAKATGHLGLRCDEDDDAMFCNVI